jgi:FixJ family two-component response regulator
LLIRCEGSQAETFSCAQEFLDRPRTLGPSCLVLDYSLLDVNGLELQKSVAIARPDMPIVFITGHRDVPMTVQAMKAGTLELLTKPFGVDVLLKRDPRRSRPQSQVSASHAELESLRERYAALSFRERQALASVVWPVE